MQLTLVNVSTVGKARFNVDPRMMLRSGKAGLPLTLQGATLRETDPALGDGRFGFQPSV